MSFYKPGNDNLLCEDTTKLSVALDRYRKTAAWYAERGNGERLQEIRRVISGIEAHIQDTRSKNADVRLRRAEILQQMNEK